MPAILYHNLLPPHRRSVCDEKSYGSWSLIPSCVLDTSVYFIEKACVCLSRTQQWGTEEKSKVCVHSGFNDVCVCVLVRKQAVYQPTAAVVGGVMSLTDTPMLRGRSEEWCRIIGGPGSRLNSYLYLLWGSICSTSFFSILLFPPFLSRVFTYFPVILTGRCRKIRLPGWISGELFKDNWMESC